jgi:hypothetical protein
VEEVGRQALKTLVALLALVVASAVARAQTTLADLHGQWVVVGLELRLATVQALDVDDPSYMGAVLEVSGARLSWSYRPGGELDDVCVGPSWSGSVVGCVIGSFGPDGAMFEYMGDRLRLEWYDNAILTLQRVQ